MARGPLVTDRPYTHSIDTCATHTCAIFAHIRARYSGTKGQSNGPAHVLLRVLKKEAKSIDKFEANWNFLFQYLRHLRGLYTLPAQCMNARTVPTSAKQPAEFVCTSFFKAKA